MIRYLLNNKLYFQRELPQNSAVVNYQSEFTEAMLRRYQEFLSDGRHSIRYGLLDYMRDNLGANRISRIRYVHQSPTIPSADVASNGYLLVWASSADLTLSILENALVSEPVYSWIEVS